MSKKVAEQLQDENNTFAIILEEVDQWFSVYFQAFIDIGAGTIKPDEILKYWSVPLQSSTPKQTKWLKSHEEVIEVLTEMQAALKQAGYTHTVAIDKKITIYSRNVSRVETIMSRRGVDDAEVDRAAVSFELRRDDKGWIIISTIAKPTKYNRLFNDFSNLFNNVKEGDNYNYPCRLSSCITFAFSFSVSFCST